MSIFFTFEASILQNQVNSGCLLVIKYFLKMYYSYIYLSTGSVQWSATTV